jgi:hypothetical protein
VKKPPKTHCPSGHALEGKNLEINRRGSRVCRICRHETTRRWIQNNPEKHAVNHRLAMRRRRFRLYKAGSVRHGFSRSNIARTVTRDHAEQMFEAVRDNGLLKAAYPIIGYWKTNAFLFFNPKIHAALIKLRDPAKKTIITAPRISHHNPRQVERAIERINVAVPRHLQRDHRDDTISDMTFAWLEGRLRDVDIERNASSFVRARFKSDHNRYGDLSLDVPIYVDGSATLLDSLSTDSGAGYWDPNMMASTGRRK